MKLSQLTEVLFTPSLLKGKDFPAASKGFCDGTLPGLKVHPDLRKKDGTVKLIAKFIEFYKIINVRTPYADIYMRNLNGAVIRTLKYENLNGAVIRTLKYENLNGAVIRTLKYENLNGAVIRTLKYENLNRAVIPTLNYQNLNGAVILTLKYENLNGAVILTLNYENLQKLIDMSNFTKEIANKSGKRVKCLTKDTGNCLSQTCHGLPLPIHLLDTTH